MKKRDLVCAMLIVFAPAAVMTLGCVSDSVVMAAAGIVLLPLLTAVTPGQRGEKGVWAFLSMFLLAIPLNVKLISRLDIPALLPTKPWVFYALLNALIYSVMLCVEEILAGVTAGGMGNCLGEGH